MNGRYRPHFLKQNYNMNNQVLTKATSVALLRSFGCKEVSTPQQKANGTDVWELPHYNIIKYNDKAKPGWKPRFAVYRSGYVRVLRSHTSKRCYQINPTYEQNYCFVDNQFSVHKCINRARMLIRGDDARHQYLVQYIYKNYKKYLEL